MARPRKMSSKSMSERSFKLKIGEKWWRVDFVGSDDISRGSWGEADWPTVRNPKIAIYGNQDEKNLIDTTIHELLHAIRPELSEEAVTETATLLANGLWKMGCRLEQDKLSS